VPRTIEDVSLLPWQSTVLTWAGGAIVVLLLIMIVMMFLSSKKKDVKEKIHTIFCFIFLAFIIAVVLANTAAISFLVDVELGWKLSLVAGASVILGVVSIVAMLIGAFGQMSMKMFWLWMFLSMLSFASVINLVMISLGYQ
jgi:hypothetical protein